MVNPHRGEVELVINGTPRAMRLTLGAMAELETRLECGSMIELAERFEAGRPGAAELMVLLEAGLRGAGSPVADAELADAEIEGGAVAALRAGMALLSAAFRPATSDG